MTSDLGLGQHTNAAVAVSHRFRHHCPRGQLQVNTGKRGSANIATPVRTGKSTGAIRSVQAIHWECAMTKHIAKWLQHGWESLYWALMEMDVTQWGILSAIFVVTGFMALKTRI